MCCAFNKIPCLFTASPACSSPLHVPATYYVFYCFASRDATLSKPRPVALPARTFRCVRRRPSSLVFHEPFRAGPSHNTLQNTFSISWWYSYFFLSYVRVPSLICLRFSRVEGVLSFPRQLTSALEQGDHCRQRLPYTHTYIYIYIYMYII